MKLVAVAVAAAFAIPSVAVAQPGVTDPEPAPSPIVQAQVDTVDENIAIGLSLGATVASWGLLLVGGSADNETMTTVGAIGTMFAPSMGHWYSHQLLTRGMGIRALGLGVGAVGLSIALGQAFDHEDNSDDSTVSLLLLAGAAMYIAGTVDDIATSGRAARKYNSRFENVNVVPQLTANGGGLAVVGRF